ncbi:response regulator transcription factor [Microbacterium sp. NEAU-LLC]|uniref:Response regulator transcription factor n=1 Tax=Microbacterium helvum TaxID=2773713 RepID=A0ABR8NLE4_9MICO|nr:response regulator transcription factor [Microbacterium helvum]MBD3941490.1 response regulator transcription factor [Microbacterium helvum]
MSGTGPIRVLIADDQALIRIGFRMVLEAEDDLVVVGEAADGEQAADLAARLRPDVVLMDVRMPVLDGIAATAQLARVAPDARVLVLTTFDLDEYAFGALEAGASGFLLKDAQRAELTSAIRAVHRGDTPLSPRITRVLLDRLGAQPPAQPAIPDPTGELTEREREVFLAMGRGYTNAEISQQLFLSESTVKTHVGRVLAKVGARDRVHAVILAHRLRLLDDDEPMPPVR